MRGFPICVLVVAPPGLARSRRRLPTYGLVALVPVAALAASTMAGCARTSEERQLDAMEQEIEHLQVDRDRADQEVLRPPSGDERAVRAASSFAAVTPPPP